MKKLIALGISLLTFALLFPSVLASRNSTDIDPNNYYFELLTFKAHEEDKTYLEIYCQLPMQRFNFSKYELNYQADYGIAVTLYNMFGNKIDWAFYHGSVAIENLEDINLLTPEVLKFPFLLEPGEYKVEIHITDLQNLEDVRVVKDIFIPDYQGPDLKLSDLQVSHSISYSAEESLSVKNNWKIMPNASRVFGVENETIYVYAEVYHLGLANDSNKGISTTFTITNLDGVEVKNIKIGNKTFGDSTFLVAEIPIYGLEPGQYKLSVNVEDLGSGREEDKSVYFHIVKPVFRFSSLPQSVK